MAGYSQEIAYVRACLGTDGLGARVADLPESERRQSVARWDDGVMTPKVMAAWALLAQTAGHPWVDGTTIYRPKTAAELEETALYREWSKRKYTLNDIPEFLDDPEQAASDWRASAEAAA